MSTSLHHVYEACPCSRLSGFVGVTNAGFINADVRRAPKLQICTEDSHRFTLRTIELMHCACSCYKSRKQSAWLKEPAAHDKATARCEYAGAGGALNAHDIRSTRILERFIHFVYKVVTSDSFILISSKRRWLIVFMCPPTPASVPATQLLQWPENYPSNA
jgi:hypothetical protein